MKSLHITERKIFAYFTCGRPQYPCFVTPHLNFSLDVLNKWLMNSKTEKKHHETWKLQNYCTKLVLAYQTSNTFGSVNVSFCHALFLKMFAQNKTRAMHIGIILLNFALLFISVFTHSFIRAALELLLILASLGVAVNKQASYWKTLYDPQLCNDSSFAQTHLVLCRITWKLSGLYHTAWLAVQNTLSYKPVQSWLLTFCPNPLYRLTKQTSPGIISINRPWHHDTFS